MSVSGWVVIITALLVVTFLMTVRDEVNTRGSEASGATPQNGQAEDDLEPPSLDLTSRGLILLGAGGLAAAPIACLIYAPNATLLADPLRVFSIASVPFVIGSAALVELLARYHRSAGTAVALALLVCTVSSAGGQRRTWHSRSLFQQNVLGAVIEARINAPNAREVIIVDTNHLIGEADVYRFLPETVRQAIEYIDPSISQVLVCHSPLSEVEVEAPNTTTDCQRHGGIISNNLGSVTIDDAAVIEIRPGDAGDVPAQGRRLPTHRMRSLLGCVESGTCADGAQGVEARLVEVGVGS